jgi:hypothetical protein
LWAAFDFFGYYERKKILRLIIERAGEISVMTTVVPALSYDFKFAAYQYELLVLLVL